MPSLTIENYVKAIFQLCQSSGGNSAATGQIAQALGVSPGTVTSMLKTLADGALASYTPYEGVSLTPAGRALALRVLRRHRLIEQFLATTLDMPWDEVHEEAEHMEHAVSDRLIDRIDAFLNFPASDPHGDPIPKADGTLVTTADKPLASCTVGETFRITRVRDQTPEFLRSLTDLGLEIGARGQVVAADPAGDVTVRLGTDTAELARDAADQILVE